jgi:hypothetical protein
MAINSAQHPKPYDQPVPDWKNPENYPGHDLPGRRIEPTIQPSEPWKDPEPEQPPAKID